MPVVGQDIPHDSARGHVSGESVFLDDVAPVAGEVFVGFAGSPLAAGRITSVDVSAALAAPGVVAVYTAADIPGHNRFGPVLQDDHLLAAKAVGYVGDPVALVVAETRDALRRGRRAVVVTIDPEPPVFSIDDAIAAGSFIGPARTIDRGDVDAAFARAAAPAAAGHRLSGTLVVGGQEHFYLESQIAIAHPGEDGTVTVHSSTQHPTEVQAVVAEVLGLPFNHVVVITKRMGGGFGGKETQGAQPAAAAALAARLTGRAARFAYDKDDDMRFTGKRHPFKTWYDVAFTPDGAITALRLDHYSNGGCSTDLSLAVMERAMLHSDNAYFLPDVRITGRVCRTNLPSNTAFRGFGGPQGVVSIENVIEEVAAFLGVDSLAVRRRNLYGIDERNTAPYGQVVRNNTLSRLFDALAASADYDRRRADAVAFGRSSPTHLRGIAMTPVKFGISFTKQHLNQANALVNVYTDGSVTVTTGGTEMGQGVNTRVRQLVADEFGISYDRVIVGATATDKNHNTSPTAASSGTDLNGAAAVDACERIRGRLATFAAGLLADAPAGLAPSPGDVRFADNYVHDDRRPGRRIPFWELAGLAYQARVNLGERGFYATPGVDYNRDTGRGNPFLYYTKGVACSEVLVDRFTGDLRVTRADLLMDVGRSINPGIDRGQVIGGFVQGMGWVTTEELKYAAGGGLLSHSPTTYKIPAISDLPAVFNVALFEHAENTVSLKRSKAVGEPPLLLGISVWAAVKHALSQATPDGRAPGLRLPATGEEILRVLTQAAVATPAAPLSLAV